MPQTFAKVPRWLRSLLLVTCCLAVATPSWANFPLAGQHYPNGSEDFVVGALPPPGVYLKNYFALFQKDRLMDDDGKKLPVDFEADVAVAVPRFIWVTPWTLFRASIATQVFFPLYWSNIRSDGLDAGTGGTGRWDDAENAGLGDIIFTPIGLGWHFGPNFHMIVAQDFFIPTGDYKRSDPASQILSKNQWTFESVVALTYLWSGFDFSAKFMYDFNTKNDDYDLPVPGPPGVGANVSGELDPGQEFHIDWALSYAHQEGLRYGISGYCYWQTTEDEFKPDGGGSKVKADKGQIFAAGPTIKYWPKQGRFSATLKHQWEFGAENLPEGQTTWLNVVWVF